MTIDIDIDLRLDRQRDRPIFLQVCDRFRAAIAQGRLRRGERVPAVRALALELGVARGTIEAAYAVLTDEGYLQARGAAGTVVSPSLPGHAAQQAPAGAADAGAPAAAPAAGTAAAGAPPIGDGNAVAPLRPLQLGLPALDAFPRKTWTRIAAQRLRDAGPAAFAYPAPAGEHRLRERVAAYLGISRGVDCDPAQVFITTGYRASLERVLRSLARPGDAVLFEDPGYFLAGRFLRDAGMQLAPVRVDAHGMVVEEGIAARPDARFAVVTPANQSPLGVTLALERRIALLDWAARAGSWIVEDDYDSEFRYQGRPLPALKSLDRHDRVIYCGTFSKVMFPGLRLAYMVVPRALAARFADVGAYLNAGAPVPYQAALADFIEEGHFARHLKKMRGLYARRRALLAQALAEAFGEALAIDLPPGGLHMVARLAAQADDAALAQRARADGFGLHCLSRWYLEQAPVPGLVLGFANVADAPEARRLALRLRAVFGQLPGNASVGMAA